MIHSRLACIIHQIRLDLITMRTFSRLVHAAGKARGTFKGRTPVPWSRVPRKRTFSWDGHGTDLLSDSLAHNFGAPKIILHAHGNSGFDVGNAVKNIDPSDQEILVSKGIVHMAGSIIALPSACYMWNVRHPSEITVEKLAPLRLLRPKLEYFFIGSATGVSPSIIDNIRRELADEQSTMVVEPMDLPNAMGTFNVLNGEDRMVAAALILPTTTDLDRKLR